MSAICRCSITVKLFARRRASARPEKKSSKKRAEHPIVSAQPLRRSSASPDNQPRSPFERVQRAAAQGMSRRPRDGVTAAYFLANRVNGSDRIDLFTNHL